MEFTATTSESRHSFTSDTKIFFGSNKAAIDTNQYLLKTFALENRMLGLRYDPESLHRIVGELYKESCGRLLPVSHVKIESGVAVFYVLPYNKNVQTLYERLRSGEAFELRTALECILNICEAVRVLHKKQSPKFFYGFLGPDCVIISEDNQVYLINYEMHAATEIFVSSGYDEEMLYFADPRVTEDRQPIDHLADIYSAGRLLEYMLTASLSDDGSKAQRIPRKIKKIIDNCTDDDESERYSSIDDLIRDISKQLDSLNEKKKLGISVAIRKKLMSVCVVIVIFISLALSIFKLANRTHGMISEAEHYKNQGNFVKSEWLYMEYIAANEKDTAGRMGYTRLLMENGLSERAEKELMLVDGSSLNSKQNSEFSHLMGRIYELKGDLPAALHHYRNAYNFDKKDIVNNITLITACIYASAYSEELEKEADKVLTNIKELTKDASVFLFIDAFQANNKKDYELAKELFWKALNSNVDYIVYESYIYLMEIAQESDLSSRQVIANQKDILLSASESRLSLPFILYITEKYAGSLCANVSSGVFTKQEKTAILLEAKELLADLYERAAISPNVYLYYAETLRENRSYEIARDVLRTAIELTTASNLVYISLVYAEYDYYMNSGGSFSAVESAFGKAMDIYNENPVYANEIRELEKYMERIRKTTED